MKLDRNTNPDGKGKYALINLRKIPGPTPTTPTQLAAAIEDNPDCVEFGNVGSDDEFFVLKLKDQFSPGAFSGYAEYIYKYVAALHRKDLPKPYPPKLRELMEYASEVNKLVQRAGDKHANCKIPD